jgi:hypothetical protein
VIAGVALAALLSACGSEDGGGAGPETSASAGASPSTSAGADEGGGDEGTAKPAGKDFEDPQGEYTLVVGETWKKVAAPKAVRDLPGQKDAEYWTVGKADKGFTPNINIITQKTPGIDLEEYKQISEDQSEKTKLKLVKSEITENADGDEIGIIEYTGDPTGSGKTAHFLATYAVKDDKAVVATLSTADSAFKKHRAKIEPLLLTLARP